MTQTVKLAKLKRSEKNVRTTPPKNIEAMAASIRARGIMQNLLVTAARPKGMSEIIAGDRRYLGAMMLAEAGEIVAADYDVPVKIITGDEADLREVSLTENFQREQMTVAEECVAQVDREARRLGISDRLHWLGGVSDCRPIYWGADALVSPSAHEGLSLAHLEAVAAGLPVIATAVGGTGEIAAETSLVSLVPPDCEPAEFARTIVSAILEAF